MSKTIKTLAVVTTLAAAAGMAYAQQTVNTPSSANTQNTTQGALVDGTGTSSGANTYRSSPTTVNNTEQAPNATSNTPQGAMGNADSNSINTSPSTMNNANVKSDATLSSDPAMTERPARADRN